MRKLFRLLRTLTVYLVGIAACFTLLLFGYFSLLDRFPVLLSYGFPGKNLAYFTFAELFVRDSELAFKGRPFYRVSRILGEPHKGNPVYSDFLELVPLKVEFDGTGFRKGSFDDKAEVVVVGDSFQMAGDSNDDTFSEHLAKKTGMRVRNLGIAWWGPPQYEIAFRRYGLQMQPRFVIYSYFGGNDLRDIESFEEWKKTGVYYHGFSSPDLLTRFGAFLNDLSEKGNGLFMRLVRAPIARLRGRFIDFAAESRIRLRVGEQSMGDLFGYQIDQRSTQEIMISPEWVRLDNLLNRFRTLSEEQSIVPLFLYIPVKTAIYSPFTTAESGSRWTAQREQQIAARRNQEVAFLTLCQQKHLHCLSLMDAYDRAMTIGRRPYYQLDDHWNSEGRQIAADLVAEWLNQQVNPKETDEMTLKAVEN